MPAQQVVAAAVETAINGLLNTQAHTDSVLSKLSGKRFTLFLDVLPRAITLVFDDKVVVLSTPENFDSATKNVDAHTCIVKTKLAVLPQLSQTSQLTPLIQRGDLDLVGDLSIAQHVSELFSSANIDFEEALAQRTTDVFAHSVFSFFGQAQRRVSAVAEKLGVQVGELITEERPIAARQQAIRGFGLQVALLSDDVEQFAEKLNAYEQTLEQGGKA